jgi:hypothetical protein
MLDIEKLVANFHEYVERAVAPLHERIRELEAREPERGEKGEPGKDAEQIDIDSFASSISEVVISALIGGEGLKSLIDLQVADSVSEYAKANPPKDGKDGLDGRDGARGEKGEAGESGRDGAGVADLLIDREGNLVATMTDGRVKSLGIVLGRDGAPGRDGKDGADFSKAEIDWEGERTLVIRGEGGEIRKTISVPMDKGYYREGMACEKADVVTHDGNAWIALRDTKAKPCHENKEDWRLFARKGRDGRDGKDGKPPPGPVRLTNA